MHREPARQHPRPPARPHGGDPALRLHRLGKAADRKEVSVAAADRTGRPGQGRDQARQQDPARPHRGLRPGRRRAPAGEAARQDRAQRHSEATRRRSASDPGNHRGPPGVPGQPHVPGRTQAYGTRRGHRVSLDHHGGRHPQHRSGANPRVQPRVQAHRSARRRYEGVGRDRLRLPGRSRRGIRHRSSIL